MAAIREYQADNVACWKKILDSLIMYESYLFEVPMSGEVEAQNMLCFLSVTSR